jgi:2-iminobutanoate/2-iminopropanoate deaminase
MIERLNPSNAPTPMSNYVQAVTHSASAKRIVVSGQVGVTNEGRVVEGMEAQLRQCWVNLFAVLEGAGFEKKHLIKTVIYVTQPDQIALSRKTRDEALGGLLAASTFIQVAGLAAPQWLAEIEGEAVKDE